MFLAKMDPSVVAKVASYVFETKKFFWEQASERCIAIHQTNYECFATKRMSLKPILAFLKKAIKHPAISASCNSAGILDVNADWFANRFISRLFQLKQQLGKEAESDHEI